MKPLLYTISIFSIAGALQAQLPSDLLQFSQTTPGSTARSISVGNALGAIGGDLSVMTTNPSALAMDYKSSMLLTLESNFNNTKSTFADNTTNGRRSNFRLNGSGFILAARKASDWESLAFGIGFFNLANFNQKVNIQGENAGSIIPTFVNNSNATGTDPNGLDPFTDMLAYDSYLTDYDTTNNSYTGITSNLNSIEKNMSIRRTGGINETVFTFAGNYKKSLYIGASLGLCNLFYNQVKTYTERDNTETTDLIESQFTEFRSINGFGVNGKFGLIYRHNLQSSSIRIGLALHTPTVYGTEEEYSTEMQAQTRFNGNIIEEYNTSNEVGIYNQRMITPAKVILSLGSVMGTPYTKFKGFIGGEVEYINYRSAYFSPSFGELNINSRESNLNIVNSAAENTLRDAITAKIGGEIVVDIIKLRAGYQFSSSPYKQSVPNVVDYTQTFSGGIGFHFENNIYLDLAYMLQLGENQETLYPSEVSQEAIVNNQGSRINLTLGSRF